LLISNRRTWKRTESACLWRGQPNWCREPPFSRAAPRGGACDSHGGLMRRTCAVLLALVACSATACTEAQRQRIRERQEARAWAEMQQRAQMDSIIVTPGDLTGRQYTIVGSVDYPGRGKVVMSLVGPTTCGPDDARRAAAEQYGNVDAIIGFTQWRDGTTPHCGGTAVRFVP
jgi:hypothetical protein